MDLFRVAHDTDDVQKNILEYLQYTKVHLLSRVQLNKAELQIHFFMKKILQLLHSSHWGFPVSVNLPFTKITDNKGYSYEK